MKRTKKWLITMSLSIGAVMGGAVSAQALVAPPSTYDAVVITPGNYSELAAATGDYNCLAYALGNTSIWEWPWGKSNPTASQVSSYMLTKGKNTYSLSETATTGMIISYGTSSSNITHFSKVADANYSNAKWGNLERLQSLGHNPYKPKGIYGYAIAKYKN
ncbi:hypothetical protein QWJ34_11485 [Saccharibacillus sp. CPCC 101409]|uniref:DUF7689 domain-containing protein n=1 Tax=Saccharibacillus sp. CPCC 101409 TaxID=3058041 RepID=UPI0026715153|nr:hypothetical protein [Saccharibacillus sp. CPCC 101409]MDO3410385.1 hypothetical protein [Saccharibacillus sp. CPCC 101409]